MENNNRAGAFVEEEIDLSQYWKVINRRKWSILTLAVLVSLLAVLIVFSITPVYKATSSLLIEPQQPKLPSIEDLYGLSGSDKQYYMTQLEILKSRKLAAQVIRDMKLDQNPEFVSDEEPYDPIGELKHWLSLDDLSEDKGDGIDHTFDLVVSAFQDRLTATLVKDTQLITLSFEAENPQLAADIANALGKAYINDQLASRVDMARQAAGWIEQRLKVLKQNLQRSEQQLQAYMHKHGLIDVKGVGTLTAQELDELTTQVLTARKNYTELSKRYGAKHPKLIAARSELHAAERSLARSKAKIQSIGQKEVKLRELQRQVDSNRQLYDTFLSRLKEASQAIDIETVNARVSDPAIAPLKSFKPKRKLIVLLAFFASLMLGVLLAFLFEALDKTFKGTADIEDKLGLPMLGLLPLIKANKKDRKAQAFAMLDPDQTGYAESMRTIRTGLILSSLDNPHKVILVTSSVPGEGKTVVSSNLAIAMAKMEKVLLIGADLRRPSMSKALEIDDEKMGLSNIVANEADFKRCIHHIEKAAIDVLPCGQLPPNPIELLSSERFAKMLAILEGHYDRIIIDSPPVQAVSDSLVLSKFAKAVVYVIESDSTHVDVVKNGIKRLQQYDAPIAGVILNKFDAEKSARYGYDYGGYYDHYGYSASDSNS